MNCSYYLTLKSNQLSYYVLHITYASFYFHVYFCFLWDTLKQCRGGSGTAPCIYELSYLETFITD